MDLFVLRHRTPSEQQQQLERLSAELKKEIEKKKEVELLRRLNDETPRVGRPRKKPSSTHVEL